ncbi:hypothetical protein EVAR_48517_1 [Eumeta japonica]|uniref:Mariner Mos1 transposase n=1 Tax=Eumeta variegata TaxID=151549 RepID=A0A4C1Z222_EUMVA|nr:hypothetical protein EVAR_48517_1 [Eumeta japonica]
MMNPSFNSNNNSLIASGFSHVVPKIANGIPCAPTSDSAQHLHSLDRLPVRFPMNRTPQDSRDKGMKKLFSRRVPRNLIETHKTDRVTWCNAMLIRFKEGASNLVRGIVTGDEAYIYCYDPKTKQQSTLWIYRVEPKQTKVACERNAFKRRTRALANIDEDGEAVRRCRDP